MPAGYHAYWRKMIALRAKELERRSRTDRSVLDRFELLSMIDCDDWSVQMHLCRMLSRVDWSGDEYLEVLRFARRMANGCNTFVRAWALDALGWFAVIDESIRPEVYEFLDTAIGTGPPSIRVRARESLRRLGR